jgi:hypothetical protein
MLSLSLAVVTGSFMVRAAEPKPTTAPTTVGSLQDGWEQIDQRLVFLTVQLSSVESSLDAVNKAIRASGYEKTTQQAHAEQARKGNELMDRNGGGPVPWSEFYGKTAQDFFYHPPGLIIYEENPRPHSARPPQFDYIYRANAENQWRAEEEIARLGNKISDLRARRTELEAQQSSLWCRIALRAVSSRDLPEHPLYQFDLAAAKSNQGDQQLAAAKAGAEFMRHMNRAVEQAQTDLESDQKSAIDTLLHETASARSTLIDALNRQPTLAPSLGDTHSVLGQFNKCTRRLQDSAQNMVDAYRLAGEGDQADDFGKKNSFRGQLQQMVMDFASSVVMADQLLSSLANEWKMTPDYSKPLNTVAAKDDSVPAEGNVRARLEGAKSDYTSSISDSRKALSGAVDSRLNAAIDAGDLKTVQALQAAKSTLDSGGAIPADVKDSAIIAAKAHYAQSIESANTRLADAYRDAVRDYTRARQLTEAQATQAEFGATGLAGAAASSSDQGARIYDLTVGLPPFLEAGPPYSIEKDGIRPSDKYLRTHQADLINHDFTFDVWFIEERPERTTAWFGFGEGLRNAGGKPASSLAMHINGIEQSNWPLALHCDQHGDEELGKMPDTGVYMVRIQKAGNAVTLAIGTDQNGTFKPDMSRRIDDIHQFAPFLHDHNSHLFFGGNALFKQVRLVVNAAPADLAASAAPIIANISPVVAAAAHPAPAATVPALFEIPPDESPAPAAADSSTPLKAGLSAEVFNDMGFTKSVATHVDPEVDFEWKGQNKPAPAITTAKYSVRWTGVVVVPPSGILGLGISADDGARLKVDGQLQFEFAHPQQKLVPGPFAPGRHTIQIEYWNRMAGGRVKLVWVPTGQIEAQPVPASALFHNP